MEGLAEAVLLTGMYGVGKTSMAEEIADLLEKRVDHYALVDLVYLAWYDADDCGGHAGQVWLTNVRDVVGNYREVGVRLFVLAGYVRDDEELARLRDAISMPLRVVRLTAPWPEIERRLQTDVTAGRKDDLREASMPDHALAGVGLEDRAIENLGPIRRTATEIVDWLGWTRTPRG